MKKNIFLYNLSVLILSGFIIKFLGLLNKVIITRIIHEEGMMLYTMAFPTILLFMGLAELGYNLIITREVTIRKARGEETNSILYTGIKVALITSIILAIIVVFIAKPLAEIYLHEPGLKWILYILIFLLPVIAVVNIYKGYFHGLNQIDIASKATLIEQIARFFLSIAVTLFFARYSIYLAVVAYFATHVIGEILSLLFLKTKYKKLNEIGEETYDKNFSRLLIKEGITLSLPRTIGTIAHFLEPIIFTFCLIKMGMNEFDIKLEYTAISGYAIQLILMFSFVSLSIGQSLMPNITREYIKKNDNKLIDLSNKGILYSLIPGIFLSVIFSSFGKEYLNLFYSTQLGVKYIEKYTYLFIFYYLQSPLVYLLYSFSRTKDILIISIFSNILKLSLLFIFLNNSNFLADGLIIAICITNIITTILYYLSVKKVIPLKINLYTTNKLIVITLILIIIIKLLPTINYFLFTLIIAVLYTILLFTFRIIKKEEFKSLFIK